MTAQTGKSAKSSRIFGLDLVRALAIVAVLGTHVLATALRMLGQTPPLWVLFLGHGVELFFALSGFLVGGLLLDILDKRPSLPALGRFVVRRWMRTIPLYVLWVIALLIVEPPAGSRVIYALKYFTFTQNFNYPMPADNWFGVSWSLTIEEWFYLLFASLAIGLATRRPRKAFALTCGIFLILPLLLRIIAAPHIIDFDGGFRKVTIYRLDAIAYGAIAVFCHRKYPNFLKQWNIVLLLAGMALVWGGLCPLPNSMQPWVYSLLPLGFSLGLPAAARLQTRKHESAIIRIIRWLSTRSYGLYIIHLTFVIHMEMLNEKKPAPVWVEATACLLVMGLVAELLYRYIETPVLLRRPAQFLYK